MRDKRYKKIFSNAMGRCRKCPLYSDGFCRIDDRRAICDTYSGRIIELPDIMLATHNADELMYVRAEVINPRHMEVPSGGVFALDNEYGQEDNHEEQNNEGWLHVDTVIHFVRRAEIIDIECIVGFDNSDERNDDGREDMP